jgi:hypothetical protein
LRHKSIKGIELLEGSAMVFELSGKCGVTPALLKCFGLKIAESMPQGERFEFDR